jgi:aryl-alcohol dehydrogenase-like predicted oxidoreductase
LFGIPHGPLRLYLIIAQLFYIYKMTPQHGEIQMTDIGKAGTFRLGGREVTRLGYGAMQLAGPGVFGPPKDRDQAIAVLREALASGVNHIDTSDYYGPHITNKLIREALAPYPDNLVLVTKLGARRGDDASWLPALEPEELAAGLQDNLRNLGLEAMEVVNLRIIGSTHAPAEGSIARQVEAMADLQRKGLVRHLGLSNVTRKQVEEAQSIAPVVCVQNHYNLVHREDDELIDWLAEQGIAYTPFFPLGGFSPLQSDELGAIAAELNATPMQVALAWLLQRSPNILLIPGTSSLRHLRENLAAAKIKLPGEVIVRLDAIRNAATVSL